MRFAPVFLPEERRLNGRASQTFLKHYSLCPRSGWLYALYKGEAATKEMQRGKAVHLVHERATAHALLEGEPAMPAELVKVLADEVLAEVPVPFEEHDYIRECAYRMARELAVDPDKAVAVETLFAVDVGGYEVRCRIDFAELVGDTLHVEDYKSSRAAVPESEMGRKVRDESGALRLMATDFQLVLYVIALIYGVPVMEHDGEEVREPFPVAARAQHADVEFVYPGIEDRDGNMLRRRASLTRADVEQYRVSLAGLLQRVAHSEETGDWPAVASDAACSICPAARLCPIPAELNDHRSQINTDADCADALERRLVVAREQRALAKEIRAYVRANGPVAYGGEMVAEIGHRTKTSFPKRDEMFAALEAGEPFDRARWVKVTDEFPLVERALTADEMVARAAEENGHGEGDEQQRLDERFGADAPF